jgi:Flp pilus assembly protein TadD
LRAVLERERGLLEEGWLAHNLAKLTQARDGGIRVADLARSGGVSAAVQQEAETFRDDAAVRLERARKNRALMEAVLDVSGPQETWVSSRNETGPPMLLAQPSEDEQYADAFRRWGLDVDAAAEAEVAERLGAEPPVVVQELIAALDGWMLERRQHRPEAQWRRLFRVAERLDRSEQRRRLRALLVGESPSRVEIVAGLVGVGSPWPALWGMARGNAWRQLSEVQKAIDPRTEPAQTVVLLAQAYAAVGDLAGAEKLLRRATTARPDQVVLLDMLGKLLERQGPSRLAEAIEYFRAARGQRPQLGIALSTALLNAGRAGEAEQVLQELAPWQSNQPPFHVLRGIAAYHQKKHGEAEAAWRQAIALRPNYAGAYHCLGVLLADGQKHSAAEAACRKAIALRPDFAEAYTNLGDVLGAQRKHRAAEAAYCKAITLKPDLVEAHNNLGNALVRQGKFGEAEAAFRKALDLRPDLVEAYSNLSSALMGQQKYRPAEAACRKAIALKPDYALAHNNLGNALVRQGKHGEAEAAYRKTLDLRPDFAEASSNLGIALVRQGKHGEAEAAFHKALGLKPDLAEAHSGLGQALTGQDRLLEAEAAFRKALGLKPDHASAYINLGLALMQQSQFDKAAPALKKAGELFPASDPDREWARRLQQNCPRYAVLDARLPGILRGTEKPADAAEQLDLAQLCVFKKQYAAAARFSRDAFTAEPKRAEVVAESTRYNAACAAALAGCGQGKDADKLDDKERALWRRQALDWLREDVTWWCKALDNGDAQTNTQTRQRLLHWKTDRDLVGVRAQDALARLPDEERKQWERLWSDVDALLRGVSQPE